MWSDPPTLQQEMVALDAMPERVRAAIKYAVAQHSPTEIAKLINEGWDEQRVINCIINTDAMMVQSEPLVKELING